MIGVKKDGWVGFDANEYWISWDGSSTGMMGAEGSGLSKEAPADYVVAGGETPTEAPTEAPTQAPADDQTQAPADNQTEAPTQAPTTGSTQKAPTTGDSVAMTVVVLGLVAAVAFVVSKKKANA